MGKGHIVHVLWWGSSVFSFVTGIYSYKSVQFLLKYIMKSWECETHTEAGSKEGGKKLFFKSHWALRPIINLFGKKKCDPGNSSEETILNAWHFPIKIRKCKTISCVLSPHCLIGTCVCHWWTTLLSADRCSCWTAATLSFWSSQ